MSRLNKNDRKWLEERFGERANFDPTERVLYSHDIAAMPSLFKPLVGRTLPDAVVQPETEEKLRELVRWANGRRIALVPRGKGSSGYGGLIPVRRGVVVDFFRMKDVLSVDVPNETVLALCPCCEFRLRVSKEKKNTPIEVRDLASFACEGLGKKFADPSPEVGRQWKVFEGMVALMTPQGFAGLMDAMWPSRCPR
ncbi:MAG: FAD-binding protein [Candidatus Aminicenantales bacterium]